MLFFSFLILLSILVKHKKSIVTLIPCYSSSLILFSMCFRFSSLLPYGLQRKDILLYLLEFLSVCVLFSTGFFTSPLDQLEFVQFFFSYILNIASVIPFESYSAQAPINVWSSNCFSHSPYAKHGQDPSNNTDLTLQLNSLNLVPHIISFDFHNCP